MAWSSVWRVGGGQKNDVEFVGWHGRGRAPHGTAVEALSPMRAHDEIRGASTCQECHESLEDVVVTTLLERVEIGWFSIVEK